MFKKGVKIFAGVIVGTTALIKITKVNVDGFPLNYIYPKLYQLKPSLAHSLLSSLIYWDCLKPLNKGDHYLVLEQGWDTNGNYLQQLHNIGFDLVINGPSSFDPHQDSMGLRFMRMKYKQFKQKNPECKLAVSILPSYDVCIYTPYLISVDLLRQIKEIGRQADYIIIDLNDKGFPNQYINPDNISQIYQKADQQTKQFKNKPKIIFRYLDQIITNQSLKTQQIRAKLLVPKNNQEIIQYKYNTCQLSQILNKPILKIISTEEFFKDPSLISKQ